MCKLIKHNKNKNQIKELETCALQAAQVPNSFCIYKENLLNKWKKITCKILKEISLCITMEKNYNCGT